MFIRSLMLSYEHFISNQTEHNDYAMKESRLLRYIGAFDRQLDYLHKLINTVNVEELTQVCFPGDSGYLLQLNTGRVFSISAI
jgi:Trpc4-associated protein